MAFNVLVRDMHPYVADRMFAEREGIFGKPLVVSAFVSSADLRRQEAALLSVQCPAGCHVNLLWPNESRRARLLFRPQVPSASLILKCFASESSESIVGNEVALDVERVLGCA